MLARDVSQSLAHKPDDLVLRQSAWHSDWSPTRIHVMHCRAGRRWHGTHVHHHYEIVFCARGALQQRCAAGEHRMRAGDIMVMHPQAWHDFKAVAADSSIYNCLFDDHLIGRHRELFSGLRGAFDLFRRRHSDPVAQPPVFLRPPAGLRERHAARLAAMLAEQEHREPGWQTAQLALLLGYLVDIGRLAAGRGGPVSEHAHVDPAVLHAVEILEGAYHLSWNLETLAGRVGLSPWALSRRFTAELGMGFVDFLNRLRVEEVCRRLSLTDDSITSIALDAGFQDPSYCSRVFRRVTGRSPRQYRRLGPLTA